MMNRILMLISLLIYLNVLGKTPSDTTQNQLLYKNEFSLDISPAIRWAIAPHEGPESVSATYRRLLSNKHALRISYRSSFSSFSNMYPSQNASYAFIPPDSIVILTFNEYNYRRNFFHSIRTGYEYRFGKRKVTGIVGIDLLNGIYDYHNSEYIDIVRTDIVAIDSSGYGVYLNLDSTQFFPHINHRVISYMIGITPVLGLRVEINNRWSFAATMVYDLYFNIPFRQKVYAGPSNVNVQRGFNVWAEAPFGDVSLTYSFGKNRK